MKYAITFAKTFRYFNLIDEVIITPYKGDVEIIEYVEKTFKPEQRVILDLTELEESKISSFKDMVTILKKLKEINPLITAKISITFPKEDIDKLKDAEIPFIFMEYAENFEMFYVQKELGASDIYVTGALGFYLDKLQPFRDKVKLRVFPNIAQSTRGTTKLLPQLIKFYIRPEDIELYQDYIDVLEIFPCKDRTTVIYEIYKRQQWLGKLSDIIMDLDSDIDNDVISPYFALHRIKCHQDCLLDRCTLCQQIYSLGKKFEEAEIVLYKPSKEIREISDEEKQKLIDDFKQKMKERLEENESKVNEETMSDSGGLSPDSTDKTT